MASMFMVIRHTLVIIITITVIYPIIIIILIRTSLPSFLLMSVLMT